MAATAKATAIYSKREQLATHRKRRANLEVIDSSLGPSTVTRIVEVAHIHEPDEDANDGNDFGEEVSEIVDLLLEGSLLADLRRDGLVDVPKSGESTGGGDDSGCGSVDDGRSLIIRRNKRNAGLDERG